MQFIENTTTLELNTENEVTKKQEIFYNPKMKFNRDITLLILKEFKPRQIALPMSASGIRGIRILNEIPETIVEFNDYSENAIKKIKQTLKNNNITKNFKIHKEDANLFLKTSKGFDYIDLDPFGSPVRFLESAIERLSRKSIFAITATDTAPLAGTFPNTCRRRYHSTPLKNELMHEVGLRILIKSAQEKATEYDRTLIPILAYHQKHYYRVFFKSSKSKTKCNEIIKQHNYLLYCPHCLNFTISKINDMICCEKQMQVAGPLWSGKLYDKPFLKKVIKNKEPYYQKAVEFLTKIVTEIDTPFFTDIQVLATLKKQDAPKILNLMETLEKKGLQTSRTQFSPTGLKTKDDIIEIFDKKNN